jgi:hypothetical protein
MARVEVGNTPRVTSQPAVSYPSKTTCTNWLDCMIPSGLLGRKGVTRPCSTLPHIFIVNGVQCIDLIKANVVLPPTLLPNLKEMLAATHAFWMSYTNTG